MYNVRAKISEEAVSLLLERGLTLLHAILAVDEYEQHGITGVEKKKSDVSGNIQSIAIPLSFLAKPTTYIIEKDNVIELIDAAVGHIKIFNDTIRRNHMKNLREFIYDFTEFWTDV